MHFYNLTHLRLVNPNRHIRFRNPSTRKNMHFLQTRWQNVTLAPWLQSVGFTQDPNETCAYRHEERDMTLCIYVDDTFIGIQAEDAGGE